MSDLVEFLLARVAEDEEVARRTAEAVGAEWASWNRSWDLAPVRDLAGAAGRITALPTTIDEHVTHHDPARVLAQCEAVRRIASRCDMVIRGCEVGMFTEGQRVDAQDNLRALALPYAAHPDYRAEWRL